WGFGDIQSGFVNKGVVFFFTRRPCLRILIENRDASHTFLQKKKGKKRKPSCLVEGFKKASFSDKILPN
ncbi:hypothetical protein, partial [Flavobacterium sp.]|uniref:hypothetical protein n=1 Tax=Flavobacterium sp. TaxID=239 RepID=UPI004048159E